MATMVVEPCAKDELMLKARTGQRSAGAALREWIVRANPGRTANQLKGALVQSKKEEKAAKGRRFMSGRQALRWLES